MRSRLPVLVQLAVAASVLLIVLRALRVRADRIRGGRVLGGLPPVTQAEIELYVPASKRNLGTRWRFTRGAVLSSSERTRTRTVGSLGGFDIEPSYDESYSVYFGVYGYYDHRERLHTFRFGPTENASHIREGRQFIILFDSGSPRRHHLFPLVRLSHPMRRYDE